jgi:hypothetical protein
MPRTLTLTIVVPDGPLTDEQDIKDAFTTAHREFYRLRKEALNAYDAKLREGYGRPVMGTVMLSDAIRLGIWLPRDHWKAGTLRPRDKKGQGDEHRA